MTINLKKVGGLSIATHHAAWAAVFPDPVVPTTIKRAKRDWSKEYRLSILLSMKITRMRAREIVAAHQGASWKDLAAWDNARFGTLELQP